MPTDPHIILFIDKTGHNCHLEDNQPWILAYELKNLPGKR